MAEEEQIVTLRDDFYRDSIGKVLFILAGILLTIAMLIGLAVYLHLNKPKPILFKVDAEWRIQPSVPINQPYLSQPKLFQWISEVITKIFVFDFLHYNEQLKTMTDYFTADGWKSYLNQLNIYVNYNNVQSYRLFVTGAPSAAPSILDQGLSSGKYAWVLQVPVTLSFVGYSRSNTQPVTFQIVVVRIPTLNNLGGVAIDNITVLKT